METLVKLNNQTAGRDKLARLLQYLSRVLWHRFQQNKSNYLLGLLFGRTPATINGFKNLEFQLSTFRKLLRFGKCLDVLHSAVALLDQPDATLRYSLVLGKIATALFLLADHLLWLGRADVLTVDTAAWGRLSNKYWLYAITMNLVRDFYEISVVLRRHQAAGPPWGRALAVVQGNRAVLVDTVRNLCDFFIPLSALGHVALSPGTVGWLGVVSSVAGLMVLVEPKIKLAPA